MGYISTFLSFYHLFLLPYWAYCASLPLNRGRAAEGAAEQAVNNHTDTLRRWLSPLLEQQTRCFHPKGLFLSELHRFLGTVAFRQISQPKSTRFSRAAQRLLNAQGDPGAVSSFLPCRSSSLFTYFFFPLLVLCVSCFYHPCSSFCDHIKWCLFCSAQSVDLWEALPLLSTAVYKKHRYRYK